MKFKTPGFITPSRAKPLLLTAAALLILSAILTLIAFALIPDRKTVVISQAKYDQTGVFDYTAYLKPSYLFGPEPLPSPARTPTPTPQPLSNLKYPVDGVERFKFDFSYQMNSEQKLKTVTEYVEALASGLDSEGNKFEAVLLPKSKSSGPFSIGFELIPDNQYSGGDIQINVLVYAAIETEKGLIAFESYTHSLKVKLNNSIWEVERSGLEQSTAGNLGEINYVQKGKIDLTVKFKADSAYSGISLGIPPVITPTPTPVMTPADKMVGTETVLFSKLVNKLDMSFKYSFSANQPVSSLNQTLRITATLENPDLWSRDIVLVDPIAITSNTTTKFEIDMNDLNRMLENIRTETGVPVDSCTLTIKPEVSVKGQTNFGDINDSFKPALSTSLGKGMIEWKEKLVQNKPGSIGSEQIVSNTDKYLGFSVSGFRMLSIILILLLILFFAFSAFVYWRTQPAAISSFEKAYLKINQKHAGRIVESVDQHANFQGTAVNLASFEDLLKLADELNRPIIHFADGEIKGVHYYYLLDGESRYQYTLKPESEEQ